MSGEGSDPQDAPQDALHAKLPTSGEGFDGFATLSEPHGVNVPKAPGAPDTVEIDQGDPRVGETLGFYTITERLGEGAMGAVYSALNKRGQEFALKVLVKDAVVARERFVREAKALLEIKHPGIVALHDFGVTDDGTHFLVMEKASGENLWRRIQAAAPLKDREVRDIAIQVVTALEAAHAAGFIHRDLKPANIMYDDSEAGMQVKLLDFGLAGLCKKPEDFKSISDDDAIVGTPIYMAPEQISIKETDERSDLYSLGIIMYEMLAGFAPFEGDLLAVLHGHCGTPPPAIDHEGPLVDLVFELLAKAPEERPSITDVKARLTAMEEDTARFEPARFKAAAAKVAPPDDLPTLVDPAEAPAEPPPVQDLGFPIWAVGLIVAGAGIVLWFLLAG